MHQKRGRWFLTQRGRTSVLSSTSAGTASRCLIRAWTMGNTSPATAKASSCWKNRPKKEVVPLFSLLIRVLWTVPSGSSSLFQLTRQVPSLVPLDTNECPSPKKEPDSRQLSKPKTGGTPKNRRSFMMPCRLHSFANRS